jgi:hypothetical protein
LLQDADGEIITARMTAISAAKKKSDKLDARTLGDLLRANFRRLVVEEVVRFKNKTSNMSAVVCMGNAISPR